MKIAIIGSNSKADAAQKKVQDLGGQAIVIPEAKFKFFCKANLETNEEIKEKTRFYDLFRVVYSSSGQSFEDLKQQGIEKGLKDTDITYLADDIDNYIDIDVIVNCCIEGDLPKVFAVNEMRFHNVINYNPDLKTMNESDFIYGQASEWEKFLPADPKELINGKKSYVIWDDLENCLKYTKVKTLLNAYQNYLESIEAKFQSDLIAWKGLDIVGQRKTAKPLRPQQEFNLLFGSLCRSFDKLSNRDEFFVTIEERKFLNGEVIESPFLKTFPSRKPVVLSEQGSSVWFLVPKVNEKGIINLMHQGEDNLENFLENSLRELFHPAE